MNLRCTAAMFATGLMFFAAMAGTAIGDGQTESIRLMSSATELRADSTAGKNEGVHPYGQVGGGFQLASNARQGGKSWWIVDFYAHVEVKRLATPTLTYLSFMTNGRTAVQVKVEIPERGDSRPTTWSFYGIVSGTKSGQSRSGGIDIHVQNYLQLAGVQPGTNAWSVSLEHFGGPNKTSVHILPTTKLMYGLPAPANPKVVIDLADITATQGVLNLPVTMRNRGGAPSREVVITVNVDGHRLRELQSSEFRVKELTGQGVLRRVWRYRIVGSGRTRVDVRMKASVGGSRASAIVMLPSSPTGAAQTQGGRRYALIAVALVPAGVALFWPRRFSRRR